MNVIPFSMHVWSTAVSGEFAWPSFCTMIANWSPCSLAIANLNGFLLNSLTYILKYQLPWNPAVFARDRFESSPAGFAGSEYYLTIQHSHAFKLCFLLFMRTITVLAWHTVNPQFSGIVVHAYIESSAIISAQSFLKTHCTAPRSHFRVCTGLKPNCHSDDEFPREFAFSLQCWSAVCFIIGAQVFLPAF